MIIVFEDDSIDACDPIEHRQVVYGEVIVDPQRVPEGVKMIWMDPPTYALRTFTVRCKVLQPNLVILTSTGPKAIKEVLP